VVARGIGVTFQQIQRYESGSSRISASRLYDLSRHLKVQVAYFYTGLPGYESEGEELPLDFPDLGPEERQRLLSLVKHFRAIHDKAQRKHLLDLMRSVGASAHYAKPEGDGATPGP